MITLSVTKNNHSGENNAKSVEVAISKDLIDKDILLEFELPDGNKFFTDFLDVDQQKMCATYLIQKEILYKSGNCFVQAVATDSSGTIEKSDMVRFRIYKSVNALKIVEQTQDAVQNFLKNMSEIKQNGISEAFINDDGDLIIKLISGGELNCGKVAYTADDILSKIKSVDGVDSELDADLLDGQHGSYYVDSAICEAEYSMTQDDTDTTGKRQIHNLTTSNETAKNIKFEVPYPVVYKYGDRFTLNGQFIEARLVNGENIPQAYFAAHGDSNNIVTCFRSSHGSTEYLYFPITVPMIRDDDGGTSYSIHTDTIHRYPLLVDSNGKIQRVIETRTPCGMVMTVLGKNYVTDVSSDWYNEGVTVEKHCDSVRVRGRISYNYDPTYSSTSTSEGLEDRTILCIMAYDDEALQINSFSKYYFAPCGGKRIARLFFQKDTDNNVRLIVDYIFDWTTGAEFSGETWIQIDGEYYSGYPIL